MALPRFLLLVGAVLLLFGPPWAMTASAQMAGQRVGGCGTQAALQTPGQRELVAVMSLVTDDAVTVSGNPDVAAAARLCAGAIRYARCTDDLLFGLLDPVSASIFGGLGFLHDLWRGDRTLIGGMMGSAAGGLIGGTIKGAQCRKQVAEHLEQPARSAFAGWRVDVAGVQDGEAARVVDEAVRRGRLSPAAGQSVTDYVAGVAQRLAAMR